MTARLVRRIFRFLAFLPLTPRSPLADSSRVRNLNVTSSDYKLCSTDFLNIFPYLLEHGYRVAIRDDLGTPSKTCLMMAKFTLEENVKYMRIVGQPAVPS